MRIFTITYCEGEEFKKRALKKKEVPARDAAQAFGVFKGIVPVSFVYQIEEDSRIKAKWI
jgi:hypothetical protein